MVDLRSDTVTQPTPAMKAAMFAAPLGDDVLGDDPSVKRLERLGATLLGKEAALFVPSGTMGNQLGIAAHTRPGDQLLAEAGSHIVNYESGGPAALSGVTVRALEADRGLLSVEQVVAAIRPPDDHLAPSTLLCVEDTANRGGGSVYPLEVLDRLSDAARRRGLACHLDAARGFNASVASGIPLLRRARGFDTVSICLSKGLGAPVGSLFCGSEAHIRLARRTRKRLGGGMRQSGFLAAAGTYALEHNIERLGEDHRRATLLGEALLKAGREVRMPETNIVFVRTDDAPATQASLEQRGVLAFAVDTHWIRLVTHLDVDDAGIEKAISVFSRI